MSVRDLLGLPPGTPDADVLSHIEASPGKAALRLLGLDIQPLNDVQQAIWGAEGRLVGPAGQHPRAMTVSHLHGTMLLYVDLEALDEPGFPPHHLPVNVFAVAPAPDDEDGERPDLSWIHLQYGPGEDDHVAVWAPDDLELMIPQDGLMPLEDDELEDDSDDDVDGGGGVQWQ
jgi:hypothetical protein